MFRKVKGLLAARRAAKKESAFTRLVGLESVDKVVHEQVWSPERTYKKASSSSVLVGTSVVATGGPLAALLILARTFAPDVVPWSVEVDATVIAAITTILASLLTFIRKWRSDKRLHGGHDMSTDRDKTEGGA